MATSNVVPTSLSELICTKSSLSTTQDFWEVGEFSTHGKVSILESAGGALLSDKVLEKSATAEAKKLGHLNLKYGRCLNSQKAWIYSSPFVSPEIQGSIQSGVDKITAPQGCSNTKVYFAEANALGISKDLYSFQGSLFKLNQQPVVYSVWCGSDGTKRLAALIPSKLREFKSVPFLNEYAPQGSAIDSENQIASWISKIRSHAKLPVASVSTASDLGIKESVLSRLLIGSVQHDRELLQSIDQSIRSAGWQLAGEDRVVFSTTAEAVRLLWYSANHRQLVLDKKNNSFFIKVKKIGGTESNENVGVILGLRRVSTRR